MEIAGVVVLIGLGFLLILIEIMFVPGTTVVGIFGLLVSATGVYITFDRFGSTVGYWTLFGSLAVFLVLLFFGFKYDSWNKLALKTSIDSKVNELDQLGLVEKQEGITMSDLKPIGKAEFEDLLVEVSSDGNFIKAGEKIIIQKILPNKIIVKLLKH